MKKENIKRLLTEMIEREFDTNEISDVFYYIDNYLSAVRNSKRENEDDEYLTFWKKEIPYYREWLEKALGKYSLDYTIQEIEEKF